MAPDSISMNSIPHVDKSEGRLHWVTTFKQRLNLNVHRKHRDFIIFIYLSSSFFKLWKYANTFTRRLEYTEHSYIQFHYILQLFFK